MIQEITSMHIKLFRMIVCIIVSALFSLIELSLGHALSYSSTCRSNYTIKDSHGQPVHIIFKDLGSSCPYHRQCPSWLSCVDPGRKPQFQVIPECDRNSEACTLNITWVENSWKKQRFLFKAKFKPDFEIRNETKRCVGMKIRRQGAARSKQSPHGLQRDIGLTFSCLSIPHGEIGALQIIPIRSSKQEENVNFNTVCTCEHQTFEVFNNECRLDIVLHYVTHVTEYDLIVTHGGHVEPIIEETHKRRQNKELIPLAVHLPGTYTITVSFWCKSGRHGSKCRSVTDEATIPPNCKTDVRTDSRTGITQQSFISGNIFPIILVMGIVLLATIVTVVCSIIYIRTRQIH